MQAVSSVPYKAKYIGPNRTLISNLSFTEGVLSNPWLYFCLISKMSTVTIKEIVHLK